MQVPINYVAVLVATVANMFVGFLWHGPLFGKQWIKLSGMTPEKMKAAMAEGVAKSYAITIAGNFLMAFVLAHALIFASAYLNVTGIAAGLMAGVWNWLGFIMPVTLAPVLWEGRSWKLWMFNNSYHLFSLCLMGVILSLW